MYQKVLDAFSNESTGENKTKTLVKVKCCQMRFASSWCLLIQWLCFIHYTIRIILPFNNALRMARSRSKLFLSSILYTVIWKNKN